MKPKILAYYFPNWHADARNAQWFGEGWTEWDLLRSAEKRFAGHRQPRTPALGEFDESDPAVFDLQIDLAVSHGIDGFLFDYYWYEDGPFLQRALDEGFLGAERTEMTFALMWANHAYVDVFPAHSSQTPARVLTSGEVSRTAFEKMVRHITDNYFSQSNYIKIDNRPFFSIYDVDTLVAGLGGVAATKAALEWFDAHVRSAGFTGIHLDVIVRGQNELPGGVEPAADTDRLVSELAFSSASSYVWIHHAEAAAVGFPKADWEKVRDLAFESYERTADRLPIPFYPNVTVGWDCTPRTDPRTPLELGEYPWIPASDPTPEEFAKGVEAALEFVERRRTPHAFITLNAWNEWTEGSVLLPDTDHGLGYLQALKSVLDARQTAAGEIVR